MTHRSYDPKARTLPQPRLTADSIQRTFGRRPEPFVEEPLGALCDGACMLKSNPCHAHNEHGITICRLTRWKDDPVLPTPPKEPA